MKEIKTELIWKSCEDNPPTKTDEYIILTKDRRNGKLELFFATYDAELNEWIDDSYCIPFGVEGYGNYNYVPFLWAKVNIPNLKTQDRQICRECKACRKGFFKSKPDKYVCIGVKEPFIIENIDRFCTEYK